MKLKWTEYTGDPSTLPPAYERVLVLTGDYKDLAVLYCPVEPNSPPFWHSGNGYTRELSVGQRWLRWPAPELLEALAQVVAGMRLVDATLGQAKQPGHAPNLDGKIYEISEITRQALASLDAVNLEA